MLTGREYFYEEWKRQVAWTIERGPVLDIGTPSRFFKGLAWLEDECTVPYFCSDVRHLPTLDFASDARALPIRSKSVGAVICRAVCNYVLEPQRIIDEVHRVLAPGGRAFVGLASVAPYTSGFPGLPGDVVRFTPDTARAFFASWSRFDLLKAGGIAWTVWNYLPNVLRRPGLSPLLNQIDQAIKTNITPEYWVFAEKVS
jgi:SAM-dependent methyltransferase